MSVSGSRNQKEWVFNIFKRDGLDGRGSHIINIVERRGSGVRLLTGGIRLMLFEPIGTPLSTGSDLSLPW